MAKRNTPLPAGQEAAAQALATREPNAALAVHQTADRSDRRGKEALGQGDLIVPRVALAQRTSPQLDPDKESYLPDLNLYEMFNTVTGEIYGRGPVPFIVVRATKRAMEFNEQNEVVDYNVPLNDPRLLFSTASDGVTRLKPRATLFYEFLVVLPGTMELAVLSMKGTQIATAKKLNTYLSLRPGATWLGQFSLESTSRATKYGNVAAFTVKPSGIPADDAIALAEQVFTNTQTRGFRAADQEGLNEDGAPASDIPF